MKDFLLCFALLCFTTLASAQVPILDTPPPPGYENGTECSGFGEGDISHWIAFFNDNGDDPNDCISSDWVQIWFDIYGNFGVSTSYNPNCETMPWVDCYTIIDFNTWNCCTYAQNGGGSGDFNATCIFSPSCSSCPNLESWLQCGFNCSGC